MLFIFSLASAQCSELPASIIPLALWMAGDLSVQEIADAKTAVPPSAVSSQANGTDSAAAVVDPEKKARQVQTAQQLVYSKQYSAYDLLSQGH